MVQTPSQRQAMIACRYGRASSRDAMLLVANDLPTTIAVKLTLNRPDLSIHGG